MSLGFSVVVPTLERPERLSGCLAALAALRAPRGGFEVLVVDDGGKSLLGPIVAAVRDRLSIRLLHVPHGGPAAARNAGAAQAGGSFLAFTDDDCRPEADWLIAFETAFDRGERGVLGGLTRNGLPGNLFSSASQSQVDYLYAYYARQPDRPRFFTSNNVALPRELFQKAGGFDVGFKHAAGEDREFSDRCRHLGHAMAYVPTAVVRHEHELGVGSFLRQHFLYGRGARRFHALRARRQSQRLEPVSFYLKLPRQPFVAGEPLGRAVLLAMLLVVSQAANALGFFWPSKEAA